MNGMWRRNRALERDVVVIQVLPPDQWQVRSVNFLNTLVAGLPGRALSNDHSTASQGT